MKGREGNSVWEFFVDAGGTFTDCLGRGPDGLMQRAKVLSNGSVTARIQRLESDDQVILETRADWPDGFVDGFTLEETATGFRAKVISWESECFRLKIDKHLPKEFSIGSTIELISPWEAPLLAMRLLLARRETVLSSQKIRMRLATTRCTNALLEEKGTPPVLFITSGFADLLKIGDQRRKDLFDLVPRKRKSLEGEVIEVREKISRHGKVLLSPELNKVRQEARRILSEGKNTAVVSFKNSYLNNVHEKVVSEVLREEGISYVVESSQVHSFIKWLPRCESAVIEAYLASFLRDYLDRIQNGLGPKGELLIMSSSGGLLDRSKYRVIDSLLSGPAGGVVGAAKIGQASGASDLINLDMGGTSADVSRYSSGYSYQTSHEVGDARISSTAMKIETIAAGGGSVCWIENNLLQVGPESSGADPGPACYGFGGPLCLTDVNLLLGRLDPSSFSIPISVENSESRLKEIKDSDPRTRDQLLHGFLSVADDAMANAIRKISVEEGYDPAEYSLVTFGGAGGQHACGVAEKLGIRKIFHPADSGLLSAFGLSKACMERIINRLVLKPIDLKMIQEFEARMVEEGKKAINSLGVIPTLLGKSAFIRLLGQDTSLEIEYDQAEKLEELYEEKFRKIFGYFPTDALLELYSLRVRVGESEKKEQEESFPDSGKIHCFFQKAETTVYERENLRVGDVILGPSLVVDNYGTLWIEQTWKAKVGTKGTILIEKKPDDSFQKVDFSFAAKRELFASRFFSLVEEMGVQLERTALSVNVRERLDFSCALLDESGFLVANAPHIPVHLGAMGICVRRIIEQMETIRPGDVWISNHPSFGGSHLPDITLVAPVFGDSENPIAYLANRAHHAEVGGITPGSMPSRARNLNEEGVVISPRHLFEKGFSKFEEVERILSHARFPSRQPMENLVDLAAQVASLRKGLESMEQLMNVHGVGQISKHMAELKIHSFESCREFLLGLGSKETVNEQILDDGDKLVLKITISEGGATFDFSGTSEVRKDNLNATEAIVLSSIAYCLRVLIGRNLPLNEGLLDSIRVVLPSDCLLSPKFEKNPELCPGVAGGNVEISQRLVDLIMTSFGVMACSQGTMNNLTFGNENFSHYETIGGGSGATLGMNGCSAVQVHMTNTSITDPEILEARFPVSLLGFRIRKKSGGDGAWIGGDGIERRYLFEENLWLSILSQRRKRGPEGLDGGFRGLVGKQFIIRNGKVINLDRTDTFEAKSGDCLVIKTPGGGGFGKPIVPVFP